MRKSWKRSGRHRIYIFVVILCLFSVVEFCVLINYRKENAYLTEQIQMGRRTVYIATERIAKGSILTEENVKKEVRYSDASQDSFITKDVMGKIVSMDVEEGMYLMENMLFSGEENRRDVYVSEAEIPDHIQDGNRIDVRIRYSNAEDYVVLSDKILQRETSGNGMVLKLTEEEILVLSSAVADKEYYSDVRLYVVGYPEFEQTENGKVTYPVRKEILLLLGREHVEGESRSALEKRLLQNQR